jgi:hypothetical protein
MKKLFLILVTTIAFSACTKKDDDKNSKISQPEEVVRSFVQLSSNAKELKDKLVLSQMCTGEMKSALEQMPDEQFRLFYLNGNLKIQELKILSATMDKAIAKVHYQVIVENKQGTDITKESNEREAELKERPDGWFIETIRTKGMDKLVFTKGMIF